MARVFEIGIPGDKGVEIGVGELRRWWWSRDCVCVGSEGRPSDCQLSSLLRQTRRFLGTGGSDEIEGQDSHCVLSLINSTAKSALFK